MNTLTISFPKLIFVLGLSIFTGIITAFRPDISVGSVFLAFGIMVVLYMDHPWSLGIWIPLFGLAVWSYGFNNVPLFRPLPLVDALVGFAVIFSSRCWWSLRRNHIVLRLLFLLSWLAIVVVFRLIIDIPAFGILAPRDALFAFELWGIFPAIALGTLLDERKIEQYLSYLFLVVIIWFLLYPWRELINAVSPVVGIQRQVSLFAHNTSAGALIVVPSFFWFIQKKGNKGILGAVVALLILLFIQSRGAYLAFILSLLVLLFIRPGMFKNWWKLGVASIIVMLILSLVGGNLTGRIGIPVGIDAVAEQLQTLLGKEGPGAGSFHHRLTAWPMVIRQVVDEPLGPIIGIGLGTDLFQGFKIAHGILVRKPHNDFLEIWARLGVIGLLPWISAIFLLFREALKGVRENSRHAWLLVLQITLLITSLGQPAMGFAYITIVWTTLTGLWLGTRLRKQGFVSSCVQ